MRPIRPIFLLLVAIFAIACAAPVELTGSSSSSATNGEHVQSGTPLIVDPAHYVIDQFGTLSQTAPSGSVGELVLPLDIPNGARITAARVSVQGPSHPSLSDVLLPFFVLDRFDGGSRTDRGQVYKTTMVGGTDTSSTPAAYRTPHPIALTGIDERADTNANSYALVFVGEDEYGGGPRTFLPGLELLQWAVTYEVAP